MKKISYCLIFVTLLSCHHRQSIESRFRAYMKDTVVAKFNDPSSYQFVSIKIDTFRGADYIQNTRDLYVKGDTLLHDEALIDAKLAEADSVSRIPGYKDSIWNYQAELKFRGKNKMGALVLDKIKMRYTPSTDQVTTSDN